jgi:glycosyltransferase involved in cell wall biosynthesis
MLTTTVHDMTCWLYPEYHTRANVNATISYAARVFPKADALHAVSEHTKQDAVRLLRLDAEKIHVIPNGVADHFFDPPQEEVDKAKEAYRLSKNFFLFVGTIEPRKNIDCLLDAWAQLPSDYKEHWELILVGSAGWAKQRTIARLMEGMRGMRYLGYVPEELLPGLTAAASAFVFPSFYEGFGIPVAQAMACSLPVITSEVSSLPEVAGEAAYYVDPRSVSSLRKGLEVLIEDDALRAKLAAAARERSELFRWKKSAEQSFALFEKLAGRS